MIKNEEIFYTAGEFAKNVGVTIRTIRYYDKIGILKPVKYSKSGYRLYSEKEFGTLQKILIFKFLGFSLEEIKKIIGNDNNLESLKVSLDDQKKLIENKIIGMKSILKSVIETEEMIKNDDFKWESVINIINEINKDTILMKQYKNSSNLQARINIHDLYSINKYGWHRWVYDNLKLKDNMKVLEIGCGNGELWKRNSDRIPKNCELYLTDISKGMIKDAEENLQELKCKINFKAVDIENIEFENNTFDIVVCNHVLYYVKNKEKAFSEVKRVLKDNGIFYASTIGKNHMKDMINLAKEYDKRIELTPDNPAMKFGLENGKSQLSKFFNTVNLLVYDDKLIVNKAQPIVDYIYSTYENVDKIVKDKKTFNDFVEKKIEKEGTIIIRKYTGLFESCNR